MNDGDIHTSPTSRTDWPVTRPQKGTFGLTALASYWEATPEERARVCNGAGPRWLDAFLPWWLGWTRFFLDRLWALNCRTAFEIHDWDYVYLALTVEGKSEADARLRGNLSSMVWGGSGPIWLKKLRWREAKKYTWLVVEYGYKAFFDRE